MILDVTVEGADRATGARRPLRLSDALRGGCPTRLLCRIRQLV